MKYTLLLAPVLFVAACKNSTTQPASKKNEPVKVLGKSIVIPVVKYGFEGFYTGAFKPEQFKNEASALSNKITICIDSLTDDRIFGHTIVAGNARPFTGSWKKTDDSVTVSVQEPGDDKYDGRFQFVLNNRLHSLRGTWKSLRDDINVTEGSYELQQKSFRYDPYLALPQEITQEYLYDNKSDNSDKAEPVSEAVLKINPSVALLKAGDVENMYKADLDVLRNSIYARHGYSFKNPRMRYLFDTDVDWYIPLATDVTSALTEIEKKNIALIKRYEVHAEKYYEEFGR